MLILQYVDVPGAIALSKALQTNKHLEYIDLGLNRVRKVSTTFTGVFISVGLIAHLPLLREEQLLSLRCWQSIPPWKPCVSSSTTSLTPGLSSEC